MHKTEQKVMKRGTEECVFLQKILDFYELSSGSDLQKLISQLQARIERTKQKIAAANTAEDPVTEVTTNSIIIQ